MPLHLHNWKCFPFWSSGKFSGMTKQLQCSWPQHIQTYVYMYVYVNMRVARFSTCTNKIPFPPTPTVCGGLKLSTAAFEKITKVPPPLPPLPSLHEHIPRQLCKLLKATSTYILISTSIAPSTLRTHSKVNLRFPFCNPNWNLIAAIAITSTLGHETLLLYKSPISRDCRIICCQL